jgi:hypothetical protein
MSTNIVFDCDSQKFNEKRSPFVLQATMLRAVSDYQYCPQDPIPKDYIEIELGSM